MAKKIYFDDDARGRVLAGAKELYEAVKVTMTLSKASVDYFKKAARKYHTPYQKMIRNLIDAYAARHPNP